MQLQTIFLLELIPRIIQRRKYRRTNHPLLRSGILRNLVGMNLGDCLHINDFDSVGHDKLVHADFGPPV